jgi:hypothetical protein
MSFRPIQMKNESRLSERTRSLISKGTLLVVAIVCFYAGYKCISVSRTALAEANERAGDRPLTRHERRMTGAGLPFMLGLGLCGLGVVTGAGAVLPWSFFQRFVRPPGEVNQRIAARRDYFK